MTNAQNSSFTKQFNKLREQTHPNVHELELFIETAQSIGQAHNLSALELKYLAMTTIPTTIEKTMSPWQLYESNSTLWAVELSARGIERFMNREKYNGKLPKILFDDYYSNAKQGFYFDDNIDVASYYPTIITDLMKGI